MGGKNYGYMNKTLFLVVANSQVLQEITIDTKVMRLSRRRPEKKCVYKKPMIVVEK